jgi:hypothetical protein
MNTKRLKAYLVRGIIGLSVALAVFMPVKAQSDQGVRVTVPFDFIVGDHRLPAGNYSLQPHTMAQGVMMITNRDEKRSLMFSANFAWYHNPQGEPRLVFDRYEDQYFLRQVWTSGADSYDLPESRTERSLEKDLARDVSRRVEVVQITDSSQ